MQAYANENKINLDLKTTDSGAAAIEDAVFVLIVCLCSYGKALEEHFRPCLVGRSHLINGISSLGVLLFIC